MEKQKNWKALIDQLVKEERETAFNPYLSTRIMAAITEKETGKAVYLPTVPKLGLALLSLLVVVGMGVGAGSLYHAPADPGVVLVNDHNAEHFGFYTQPEEEQ
ncbi:MAG: hypothetical protein HYZ15_10630 [Sphingobacteriales bacterium]|nr:hypothetical protein [Sphingobacteriales bacterium]